MCLLEVAGVLLQLDGIFAARSIIWVKLDPDFFFIFAANEFLIFAGCDTTVTRFFMLRLVLYETGAVYQSSHQPGPGDSLTFVYIYRFQFCTVDLSRYV